MSSSGNKDDTTVGACTATSLPILSMFRIQNIFLLPREKLSKWVGNTGYGAGILISIESIHWWHFLMHIQYEYFINECLSLSHGAARCHGQRNYIYLSIDWQSTWGCLLFVALCSSLMILLRSKSSASQQTFKPIHHGELRQNIFMRMAVPHRI